MLSVESLVFTCPSSSVSSSWLTSPALGVKSVGHFGLYKFKGAEGVPWVQIVENEFECLVVRGVMVVILLKSLWKKIVPSKIYRGYRIVIQLSLIIGGDWQ